MPKIENVSLFVCVILNISIIILILILKNSLPPVVPLFYGFPVSQNQLGGQLMLTIPPLIAISFAIINFVASKATKENFIKKTFTAVSVTAAALATITVLNIIFLVGKF